MAYLVSLGLLLLLGVREWQHNKMTAALLDRLLIREGYEPVAEPEPEKQEEERTVVKRVASKEELLARAGAVRFKMPGTIE